MAGKKISGVRLTEEQRDALAKVAARNKCDVSDLIRWAVDALIEHVERNNGRLLLPVDFRDSYAEVRANDTSEGDEKAA